MGTTIKTKEQAIRYENWVNQETGEIRQFAVVDKPYSSDYNFHKVWLNDLAKVLNIIGGKKIAVFNYILKNINPYSNEIGFTQAELVKELKEDGISVSVPTIRETVNQLVECDFMRKVRPTQFRVNPKMLVKGSHNKRVGIMLKYDELNNGRQLSIYDSADDEWNNLKK